MENQYLMVGDAMHVCCLHAGGRRYRDAFFLLNM